MKKKTVLLVALMSVCATLLLIAGVTFAANAEPVGGDCGVNVKWSLDEDSGELRIYGEGVVDRAPWLDYSHYFKTLTVEEGVTGISVDITDYDYGETHYDSVFLPSTLKEMAHQYLFLVKKLYVSSEEIAEQLGPYNTPYRFLNEILFEKSITYRPEWVSKHFTVIHDVEYHQHQYRSYKRHETLDGGFCGENVSWLLDDRTGELTIYGTGAMDDYYNAALNERTPWLYYYDSNTIKYVTVQEGVTRIGNDCFFGIGTENHPELKSLRLSSTLQSIGSATVGDGENIFFGLGENLEEIVVDDANPNYTDAGNCLIDQRTGKLLLGYRDSVIPNDGIVKIIDDGAFANCDRLSRIVIPASVEKIGYYAFRGCANLQTVFIDSQTVAQDTDMIQESALIDYADTVYINSTITEVSDSIPAAFPYTHTAVVGGVAYTAYCKNPAVDTLKGYVQFRDNKDGTYATRLLVEGKSDFMEDYTTATVTLTFTKNGDSNKTLTMTALADQAYTSVMACGQKKNARPGYGFIGLVVTGIGNDDVGSISASVTLKSANGDTVTYELGSVDNVPERLGDYPVA